MHHPLRHAALAVAASHILALSVVAQRAPQALPHPQLPELLLPAEPTLGALRFDANGNCSLSQPLLLDGYLDLSPIHQRQLLSLSGRQQHGDLAHSCWVTPPSPAAAALFNAVIQGPAGFQPISRWSSTATNGGGLSQGDPTTLRYSFVPDGTFIPSANGEPAANSNLIAAFNAVFPTQAVWQNRVHDALERWGDLSGVTYVFEPNDDGAQMFGASGIIGVRGDVRIGGKFIDGGFNTLAYNFFPGGGGDMCIDTSDNNYFANSTNNYRRLFNVAGHEQGHGLGIAHVCPQNNTKLMEPSANTAFEGPQFDDMLSVQRLYGDRYEPNNQPAVATQLGALSDGINYVSNVSIDGSGDADTFQFSVTSDKLLDLTLSPAGNSYIEGPQVGNCTTGSTLNPRIIRNLSMLLQNGTSTQVLAFAASAPIGANEVIANYALTAGTYTIRIAASGADNIQMYQLAIDLTDNGPPATATIVGTGCGGLVWDPLNTPRLGLTQTLRLQNIPNPASSIGLVIFGSVAIPGGLDLTALGAPGCFLYQTAEDIVTVFPLTSSNMFYFLPIPNNPTLVGAAVWTQGGLLVPPGTNPLGALTGNAVELVLGTN